MADKIPNVHSVVGIGSFPVYPNNERLSFSSLGTNDTGESTYQRFGPAAAAAGSFLVYLTSSLNSQVGRAVINQLGG